MKPKIGPYRIERKLPHRGMGVVFQAYDEALSRPAAIKILPKTATDDGMRVRMHREAQAQARLKHEHIVSIYALLEDGPDLFIAMEWVEGETLEQLLHVRSTLPLAEAMQLFDQLLAALEFVHQHGVVHRDVKPSNVMISGGCVKLMDFGIALLADIPRQTASVIGTPRYMSPEQFHAPTKVDSRTDIYSAALVLYEMLAARLPFEQDGVLAPVHAHVHARVLRAPELKSLVPDVPAGVSDAVDIALRADPNDRFQTIAQFRKAVTDGAIGFLPPAPRSQEEIPTEPLAQAVEVTEERVVAAPAAGSTNTWLWMVSLTLVVLSVIVSIPLLKPSRRVPAPLRASAIPMTRTIVIHDPAPAVSPPAKTNAPVQPPVRIDVPPLEKPIPFAQPAPVAVQDDGEAQRRELVEQLRQDIARAFERAESLLAAEKLADVQDELSAIDEKVRRYPTDLWQEGEAVRRFTARLTDARVAARARAMQESMWEGQLAAIEQEIERGQFPEAQTAANAMVTDAKVPERFAARARQLSKEAHDRLVRAFQQTQTGETKNTIRRSSSPPRN